MMVQIDSSLNTVTQQNTGYNSAYALQLRLDTAQLLEQIEIFLRGQMSVTDQDPKSGKIIVKKIELDRQKANNIGVQSILNRVALILNPSVVQGNFPSEGKSRSRMYDTYIFYIRIDFVKILVQNSDIWEIADEDIEDIIDAIMGAIEPFMTRLIDNKEREGYGETMRHVETSSQKEQSDSRFKLPF